MNDIRLNIKAFLRSRLLGKDNQIIKKDFMDKLNFSNENIKSYTNLNLVVIPPVESLPKICGFFNVSLYELLGINDPSNLTALDKTRLKKLEDYPELATIVDNYKK